MKSLLPQLQEDEAILLMYVAEELPAQDRAAVERRLITETPLREQLDALRGVQDSAFASLRAIDSQRLPGQGAGSRRVIRSIQKWQAGRAVEQAAQANKNRFRLHVPAWTYPFAAAAVLVIGLMVWGWNIANKPATTSDNSVAWTGGDGARSIFDAPPPDPSSPVAEQYAKLEETLDDSAGVSAVDDQVDTLSDWGVPNLPRDVVAQ
jgi:anti-sigma factor RsiW